MAISTVLLLTIIPCKDIYYYFADRNMAPFQLPYEFDINKNVYLGQSIQNMKNILGQGNGRITWYCADLNNKYFENMSAYPSYNRFISLASIFDLISPYRTAIKIQLRNTPDRQDYQKADSLALVVIDILIDNYGNDYIIRDFNAGRPDTTIPEFIWEKDNVYIFFRYMPSYIHDLDVSGIQIYEGYAVTFALERLYSKKFKYIEPSKVWTKGILGLKQADSN